MVKLAFKSEKQRQLILLLPSLDELIPQTHLVRVINHIIDHLDLTGILSNYHDGNKNSVARVSKAQIAEEKV